ncbi:hypothetical protein COU60_04040 [Candidatus Pacearchaeota archaeon CG10_big_fil_rev_8_21_14_0_10_34_76]|nr:MAG: hypothetical protein COU60_04040 [Candidatus Pacearchaeota archaeon CG10_big_fil_rev_8_21_14_0_10_34_76]
MRKRESWKKTSFPGIWEYEDRQTGDVYHVQRKFNGDSPTIYGLGVNPIKNTKGEHVYQIYVSGTISEIIDNIHSARNAKIFMRIIPSIRNASGEKTIPSGLRLGLESMVIPRLSEVSGEEIKKKD